MAKIKVIQIKSNIKRISKQKLTLKALGLSGIGKEVVHEDSPNTVSYTHLTLPTNREV